MVFSALLSVIDGVLIEHLGGATIYQPEDGAAVTVDGIFDAAHVHVEAGEAGISSVGPVVFYQLAALPVDPEQDEPVITVGGIAYRVTTVKKDGLGGVRLFLHRREDD